jgi:hypothetical protein
MPPDSSSRGHKKNESLQFYEFFSLHVYKQQITFSLFIFNSILILIFLRGRDDRDRMVVGSTTNYTFSAYHH